MQIFFQKIVTTDSEIV